MSPSLRQRLSAAVRCLAGEVASARRVLPARRRGQTVKFEMGTFKWHMTYTRFSDFAPAEVFLSTAKTGDMLRHMSSDAAITTSLCLQYGCPFDVLREALARDSGGEPLSPLAAALDIIHRENETS